MNREVIESVKHLINVLDMAEKTADDIKTEYVRFYRKLDKKNVFPKYRIATGLSIAEAIYLASVVEKTRNLLSLQSYGITTLTGENKAIYDRFIRECEPRFNRLIKLLEQIDQELPKLAEKEVEMGLNTLEEIERKTYQQEQVSLDTTLAEQSGSNYRARVQNDIQTIGNLLKTNLIRSFLLGISEREFSFSSDFLQKGSSLARRLIRTESTRVHCQAKVLSLKAKGYQKYRYIAVLDKRTSVMCRAMNGKEFYLEEAVPGVNLPPLHPWCRSTIMGIKE